MAQSDRPAATASRPLIAAILSRLSGPGGYYNLGNLVGLLSGTAVQMLQVSQRGPGRPSSPVQAVVDQFLGTPSAVALSVAMLVFVWGGEVYHRAWAQGFPPDRTLNRRGDVLSGIGALFLGVGLLITGQPMLALTAGLLHALGKFGSAWAGQTRPRLWPATWPDLWRTLVVASRVPALLAAVLGLAVAATQQDSGLAILTPGTLILCYALWIKADVLLYASKD